MTNLVNFSNSLYIQHKLIQQVIDDVFELIAALNSVLANAKKDVNGNMILNLEDQETLKEYMSKFELGSFSRYKGG